LKIETQPIERLPGRHRVEPITEPPDLGVDRPLIVVDLSDLPIGGNTDDLSRRNMNDRAAAVAWHEGRIDFDQVRPDGHDFSVERLHHSSPLRISEHDDFIADQSPGRSKPRPSASSTGV
jgi:hypothetical protein